MISRCLSHLGSSQTSASSNARRVCRNGTKGVYKDQTIRILRTTDGPQLCVHQQAANMSGSRTACALHNKTSKFISLDREMTQALGLESIAPLCPMRGQYAVRRTIEKPRSLYSKRVRNFGASMRVGVRAEQHGACQSVLCSSIR